MANALQDLDALLDSCYVPMTRCQWEEWLERNITEFRQRMKTDYVERRRRSVRLRARPDLPTAASRIQPQRAARPKSESEWAVNLAKRLGWHGLLTETKQKRMFFLAHHAGETFYIDLEHTRVGDELAYVFSEDFFLWEACHPLSKLEAELKDVVVIRTFSFNVNSEPHTRGGFLIRPVTGIRIQAPLPLPRRKAGEEDAEVGDDDDCCERAEDDDDCGGREQDDAVVDTDVEIDVEVASSECSSSCNESDDGKVGKPLIDPAKELIKPVIAKPHASDGSDMMKTKATLWDNGYFFIPAVDSSKHSKEKQGLRMYARKNSLGEELGKDKKGMSKFLTPSHYGETMEDPKLTMLLLRAWMLWRADGWATEKSSRARQFEEDKGALKRDVMALQAQQGGSLLGNKRADQLLRSWTPTLLACTYLWIGAE